MGFCKTVLIFCYMLIKMTPSQEFTSPPLFFHSPLHTFFFFFKNYALAGVRLGAEVTVEQNLLTTEYWAGIFCSFASKGLYLFWFFLHVPQLNLIQFYLY